MPSALSPWKRPLAPVRGTLTLHLLPVVPAFPFPHLLPSRGVRPPVYWLTIWVIGKLSTNTLVFGTHPRRLSAGRTRGDLGRGFPNPGLRMVPACGLSGTGPHSRREVAGKRVELRLHLSRSRHLSIHLFTLARTSLRTSEPPSSGRKNVLWL